MNGLIAWLIICFPNLSMINLKHLLPHLSDSLLSPQFRQLKLQLISAGLTPHKTFGHCYILSEAAYHLLGGKHSGYTPQHIKHEGISHWYLKHKDGSILDLSAKQFKNKPNYKNGKGIGFLTKKPSKRAQKLIATLKT